MKYFIIFPFLLWFWIFSSAQESTELKIDLGEKLFMDGRFSRSFASAHQGDINKTTVTGEKVLEVLEVGQDHWQHPHRGGHMSCASCHFVDQIDTIKKNVVLTYNDMTHRTPVPDRGDGHFRTVRNSMNMVLSSLNEESPLHWDGEFFSAKALACASLVGRNMGWLPSEAAQARAHIVKVIREDNGKYPSNSEIKSSYSESFSLLGFSTESASDDEILGMACETIATYMADLDFSRDEQGEFNGSAYDQFLKLNGIRRGLKKGESKEQYLTYLRDHLNFKSDWQWQNEIALQYHKQAGTFGALELEGMKTFFGRGQCVACHLPPEFTDQLFHNTGISQNDYEMVHGKDAFKALKTPSWQQRLDHPEVFLVASENHPSWKGVKRVFPNKAELRGIDLGAWNILGHPDMGDVQKVMRKTLCRSDQLQSCQWTDDETLSKAWGRFKTPTLRSLGQSGPYLHSGESADLKEVLQLYFEISHRQRRGEIKNGDPFLNAMHIMPHDFAALEAFLNSLNEDYD